MGRHQVTVDKGLYYHVAQEDLKQADQGNSSQQTI
jgi:hypothetical protein